MRRFAKNLVKFLTAEGGPTAVEYSVLLAMIIVICLGAIAALSNNASTMNKPAKNTTASGS
jgi:pilus assembly protein Flp/PilA